MTVSPEFIEKLMQDFRGFVPKNLSSTEFQANDVFFKDFEQFKFPLIAHLSSNIESAVYSAPDTISEEFLRGYMDGVVAMIKMLADLKLIKNHSPGRS